MTTQSQLLNPEHDGSTPARLLVIQPDAGCDLDRMGGWLADAGLDITVVRPFAGEPVPRSLAGDGAPDGVIVLGGQLSVNDEHVAWLEDIRELLRVAVAAEIPTLGVCLGGQLLAQAFGGVVKVGQQGLESGLTEITWTDAAAADEVVRGLPSSFFAASFHNDAITKLPDGAEWLAAGSVYDHQAFRVGSALGVQFHPEITPARLREWNALIDSEDPDLARRLADQAAEFEARDGEIAAGTGQLTGNFVAAVHLRTHARSR